MLRELQHCYFLYEVLKLIKEDCLNQKLIFTQSN